MRVRVLSALALLATLAVVSLSYQPATAQPPPASKATPINPAAGSTHKGANGVDVEVYYVNADPKRAAWVGVVFLRMIYDKNGDLADIQEEHFDSQLVLAGASGSFWFANTGALPPGDYIVRTTIDAPPGGIALNDSIAITIK